MPSVHEQQPGVAPSGVHPFHTSPESQSHWRRITHAHALKRALELSTTGQTEHVVDAFAVHSPGFLDKLGQFMQKAAKPALITGSAVAAPAIIVSFDQNSAYAQDASPQPSSASSLEPGASIDPNASPQPSPEASLDPNCPPPVDETELATQDGTGDINFGPPQEEQSPLPSLVPTSTDMPPDFQLDEEALTDNSTTAAVEDPDNAAAGDPNCVPEATPAPTASLTPAPTGGKPQPTEGPQINLNDYSLDEFLKLKDKPLNDKGFEKIIKRAAPSLADYLKVHGDDKITPERLVDSEIKILNKLKRGWTMDWAGFSIANIVVFSIEKAENAAKEGNIEAADAFLARAQAYVRVGKTKIDFEGKPKSALDAEIRRVAKDLDFE
ncbi:MAG: hypothetical protein HYW63_04370 [Candidatus Levybacteria bacterium]|nr:hypothetical protein [Candidatus Levybacteria bacterium]